MDAQKNNAVSELKVERDPETGKILRVIRKEDDQVEIGGRKVRRSNPLNDPLDDLSDDEEDLTPQEKKSASKIVQQLERQADTEGQAPKKPRHQSKREEEWITRLVERYGDDYQAMARDRKLNPMQQNAGDLRRRISKCKATKA